MWTARAEVRQARKLERNAPFLGLRLGLQELQPGLDPVAGVKPADAGGERPGHVLGRQFAQLRDQHVPVLVITADDARTPVGRKAVGGVLDLDLDDPALLLDHQDLLEPVGELEHALHLERMGHDNLVDADAEIRRHPVGDAELAEGLHDIGVGLAACDDAEARPRRFEHRTIEPVRARERLRRLDLVAAQAPFLIRPPVGVPEMHAVRRHLEIIRERDVDPVRID